MKNYSTPRRESFLTDHLAIKLLFGFMLVAVMTVFSHRFLDAAISSAFYKLIRVNRLMPFVSHIPDLLFYIVVAVTTCGWIGYWYRIRRGHADNHARFLKLCGMTAPLAFLAKMIFQYLFGRSNPELWAVYHHAPQFHWFRASAGYGCFPSGHMTVFTALTAALWRHYPRHKFFYLGFLAALALALIATNYHFLSDVIAGAYLGAIVCLLVSRAVDGPRPPR